MPERTRQVWWAIWVYATLTVAGDIVYDVQQRVLEEAPFPGPADALYLTAYAAALIGLLILVGRLNPGRDRDAWIDTMIVTIAVAAAVGYFIAAPVIRDSDADGWGTLIALAYPFLDILLLSGLIRLVVGGGRNTLAMSLLIASFLMTLTADLVYNVVVSNGADDFSPAWMDALFLAAIVVMAAAAAAPGARTIDMPALRQPSSHGSGRLVGLSVGALTIPAILVFVAWSEGEFAARLLSLASVAVILLVLWRLRLVLATVRAQNELLSRQARTDSLTDLPNRRTFDYEVERAVESAEGVGRALTVAMIDLDKFKDYNDEHGHQAGDDLLATCARAWRDGLPADAFIARYGGEEFSVLLPGSARDDAHAVLERLRLATPPACTVSIGHATRAAYETGFEAIRRADRALYEAKDEGRNRVVAAD
jgi:diguanylate cyclase (GGDEF)-like protein